MPASTHELRGVPSQSFSSKPPHPFTRKPRNGGIPHSWTDEELNTLTHLRQRNWSYSDIQRRYFPSVSRSAAVNAYLRQSAEERQYRLSTAPPRIERTGYAAGNSRSIHHTLRRGSRIRLYSERKLHRQPRPAPRRDSPEVVDSSASNSEKDDSSVTLTNSNAPRYNLRPNRPAVFYDKGTRYPVDRYRFPHFYDSYRDHFMLGEASDSDYVPPSKSATPNSSDRSPSAVSSQLSDISSLELFGLEAHSPIPSSPVSATSSQPNDESSVEFFSAEEHLSSP